MAEEVIQGLENMKLTTEEEEIIEVPDEGRKEEIESCSQSLIGKFLTCKSYNKRAAHTTLKKAWGLQDEVQIMEVGSNLFQFKFSIEFDMERVFKGGPWTFDNQALMLRRWQRGMTATNVKFETVSLWVQIWGAPFDMVSPKVAAEVGRRLGVVEEVETRQKQEIQNWYMRVKVAIPISKPIRRGRFIARSEGERTWVTYKYERLPIFCHFCGLLGHDVRHCAGYFAASKKGEEVLCQYGDWLKSMGTPSWSPPRRGKSHTTTGKVGVMEKQGEHGKQRMATADVGAMANPPTQETSINDKGEKLATAPNIQEVNAEESRVDVEVTECEATDYEVIDSGISSFNAVEDVLPIDAMHVTTNLQVGPNKKKPKWTRFQRMESEPVGEKQDTDKPVLGKRSHFLSLEEDSNVGAAAGKNKRRKKQDGSPDNAAAGVLEHPCRAQ